jgi:hypothetical protein
MALQELRHMRTFTAAVRELKRQDPVSWALLGESHIQVLRARVATNPICDKRAPSAKTAVFERILVPVPHRTKKLRNKKPGQNGMWRGSCSAAEDGELVGMILSLLVSSHVAVTSWSSGNSGVCQMAWWLC